MCGEVEMEVKQYIWEVVDSNSWLILEDDNGLLIDVVDNQELFETAKRLKSLTVILTHSHFDHIIGLNWIRKLKPGLKVIATRLCSENIGNIYRNMSSTATAFVAFYEEGRKKGVQIEPFSCAPADQIFEEKTESVWQGHHIRLFAVHGHSDDGLIVVLDERYLFSGDTLLPIPTVTRFRGGNTKRFWEEDIPVLQNLGIEDVYPGHGKAGKMIEMIKSNMRSKSIKDRE